LFIDRYIAYTLVYVLMLLVLFAVIVIGAVLLFHRKYS
jgi:Tfp pilus assembly protein PilX